VRGKLEPVHGGLAGLDSLVDFGAREGEGKVDEFESISDGPIFVVNLFSGLIGNVISAEDPQRGVHVEETCVHHDRLR
jgi:hypothetical protein